jgi:hypothetical protein
MAFDRIRTSRIAVHYFIGSHCRAISQRGCGTKGQARSRALLASDSFYDAWRCSAWPRSMAGARSRRQLGERPIGSGGDYLKGEAVGSGRIHVCIERGTGGQPSCRSSHQVSRLIPSGAAPRVSCTLARRLFVPEKISRNKQAFELLWCHRRHGTLASPAERAHNPLPPDH